MRCLKWSLSQIVMVATLVAPQLVANILRNNGDRFQICFDLKRQAY